MLICAITPINYSILYRLYQFGSVIPHHLVLKSQNNNTLLLF